MGQTITLLNTNTIDLTKALSNTQGLFLCLIHTIIKTITLSHTITINQTITRTLTLSLTLTRTLTISQAITLSHTISQTPRITNTPTMESPPWEFCPYVGILCDKYVTPTWEFVPSVGICLYPPWEFDLVLAEEKII